MSYNKEYGKQWREKNKEYSKQYYQQNKEKAQKQYQDNKTKVQQYYQQNKEKIKEYTKEYITKNKEYYQEYNKKYREENKEYFQKWDEDNKERKNELDKKRRKEKRKVDPLFRIKDSIGSMIYKGLKNQNKIKSQKIITILGLDTYDQLREHIEKQWKEGMTWDNYGVGKNNTTWHIDHIIPISSAKNEYNIYTLNHYTNLQPMWCSDNIRKSNKV